MNKFKKFIAPVKLLVAWIMALVFTSITWITALPLAEWFTGSLYPAETLKPIVAMVLITYLITAIVWLFDFVDIYYSFKKRLTYYKVCGR